MSRQAIHPQNILQSSKESVSENPVTVNEDFEKGRRLFLQISSDQLKAYVAFKKKSTVEMYVQINNLTYWTRNEGPENKRVKSKAELYIKSLEEINIESNRRRDIPGFIIAVSDWLQSARTWYSTSQTTTTLQKGSVEEEQEHLKQQ